MSYLDDIVRSIKLFKQLHDLLKIIIYTAKLTTTTTKAKCFLRMSDIALGFAYGEVCRYLTIWIYGFKQ